jgi:hypothetical protein
MFYKICAADRQIRDTEPKVSMELEIVMCERNFEFVKYDEKKMPLRNKSLV